VIDPVTSTFTEGDSSVILTTFTHVVRYAMIAGAWFVQVGEGGGAG